MAKRKVVWTSTARVQRRNVLKYWLDRNKSSEYPKALISQIKSRIKYIADRPQMFYDTEFTDTKVCYMGHFSIFFKTTTEKVIITPFWDNRDDPEKLLKMLS